LHAFRALGAFRAVVARVSRTRLLAGPCGRSASAVFATAARLLTHAQETFVVTAPHQGRELVGADLVVTIAVDFFHHHLAALVAGLQAFAFPNTFHESLTAPFDAYVRALAAHVFAVVSGLENPVFAKAIITLVGGADARALAGVSGCAIDISFETFDERGT